MTSAAEHEQKPYRLARFARVVRERYWTILLGVIVVGAVVFGASLLAPSHYEATAEVAFSARDAQWASNALLSAGTPTLAHNVSNDALILRTSAFAARVSKSLKTGVSAETLRASVSVLSDPIAGSIGITARGTDPVQVATVADAFAAAFIAARQESTQQALTQAQSLLKSQIDNLSADEATSAHGTALKQQYDNLTLLVGMNIKDYQILQKAEVPTHPYAPRPFLNLWIGLGAGLLLGLTVALVLDYFDRRIKDRSTLEKVMDLPVLSMMPAAPAKRGRPASGTTSVGFAHGNEALLESMRMLRSNLKALGFGESKRTVLITSTAPGEGKSRLAVNLTLSMALAGDRAILVDGDLRNPMVHQYLGISNDTGLGDTLVDRESSWSARARAVDLNAFISPEMAQARKPTGRETPVSKFLCLTSGAVPANPTEILESGAWPDLLAELQGVSDYVIIDGPPMLVASDSLILAQSVDAVVLASTLGKETAAEAAQVKELFNRAEIQVLGIVMCGVKPQSLESTYPNFHQEGKAVGPGVD